MKNHAIALALSSLLLAACSDDDPAGGTLRITVYGEDYIEEAIPAAEFVDGWELSFDRFLISLGQIHAGIPGETPTLVASDYQVWDLAQSSGGAGFAIAAADVPGGAYAHVGYRIAPNASATAGNVSAADLMLMLDSGYAIYATGTATKGSDAKTFAWGFQSATTYDDCESTAVIDGGDATAQLTIHGDHLFYDMLTDAESYVAFDLIASADANADDDITPLELSALSLATESRYQVGSLPVDDLWTFIDYQTSTLGHIDGEGHCTVNDRD